MLGSSVGARSRTQPRLNLPYYYLFLYLFTKLLFITLAIEDVTYLIVQRSRMHQLCLLGI